jgi:hypothetical protein
MEKNVFDIGFLTEFCGESQDSILFVPILPVDLRCKIGVVLCHNYVK